MSLWYQILSDLCQHQTIRSLTSVSHSQWLKTEPDMEAGRKMPAASPMRKMMAWRLFLCKKSTKNEHPKTSKKPFFNHLVIPLQKRWTTKSFQVNFSSLSYTTAVSTTSTQGSVVSHPQPLRLATHWWPPAHKHPEWLYDSKLPKCEATHTIV